MKTLSIIIPSYNTPKILFSRCLSSFACKYQSQIDVIVVDDGSLEQYSNEIKAEISKASYDIHYYKKENGGQNSAREYGLTMANGQYIFFVDADDYIETSVLDDIIQLLNDKNPNILAFNWDIVLPNGTTYKKNDIWHNGFNKIDAYKGLFYSGSLWMQIYRKDVLRKYDRHLIQSAKIGEDFASATAFLINEGFEYTIDKCLYHYVKHSESIMSNPPRQVALDIIYAFEAMLEQIDEENKIKYQKELEWLAILHILYSNTVRIFICYNGDKELIKQTRDWVEKKYPNWKENPYLKTEKIAKKITFILIENKHTFILKYYYKVRGIIKKLILRICTK